MERTFFDVRVTHPNTQPNRSKSLRKIYAEQEKEKKIKYNHRILEVEKATIVTLVFTTSGGMSPECEKCNKRIAEILAIKTKESYSDIISFIRKKIRFALLKATLIAIRGYRGPAQKQTEPIADISYNLV